MKSQIFYLLGLSLVIFQSCKKTDLELPESPELLTVETGSVQTQIGWTKSSTEEYIYSTIINEPEILSTIVSNGLVLVYKSENGAMQSLPFQSGGQTWNYSVNRGKIEVMVSSKEIPSGNISFQYIIFPVEQLQKLEDQKISREELIDLPFSSAKELNK